VAGAGGLGHEINLDCWIFVLDREAAERVAGQNETFKVNPYRPVLRASRRRNCLTETTRTRWRRAILIKLRSRLRSSSRVTRYCDLPKIAASKISSSSGSRHIFSSPEICTMVARAAINRTNTSASRLVYRNLWTNRGLLRTSAISPSCGSDVMALNSSSCQALRTCPGGPVGLRKAETQTLVSSRATSGTAFGFGLGSRSSHFRFNELLWDPFGTSFHPAKQAFKFFPPLPLGVKRDEDAGLLFQSKRSKRSQYPFLVNGSHCFFHRVDFSWQRHQADYNDARCLRQAEWYGCLSLDS
jgi:hypothetical protein